MRTYTDVEDLRSTKSEKLLAVVMTVFLLIGGIWTYQKIDDYVRDAIELRAASAADQAAVDRHQQALNRLFGARNSQARARRELELRRERYRTALDAGQTAPVLEREYRAAETTYAEAGRDVGAAQRQVQATSPAAEAAQRRISAKFEERRDRQERVTLALRLLLTIASLLVGLWLLARLRRRNSRYLPLAGAVVLFATILAFGLAGDYLTDYFDPFDLGLLFLSLLGVVATLVAFALLQRYLQRRLPQRRVRKRECPFCGYPTGDAEHCEGCGRQVLAACAACGEPRRVGTSFCRVCGASA